MRIGHIQTSGDVFAAPMAGVTDASFRAILAEYGAALLYTEMISAKGLIYRGEGTLELLRDRTGSARQDSPKVPVSAQLFGRVPDELGEAAAFLAGHGSCNIIDINCGCPAPKITKSGEGAALLKEPALIGRIVAAVVGRAGNTPVTVKLRKGFGRYDDTAVLAAKHAEANGAAALCVHGRTASQMYGGEADWDTVSSVAAAVSIPVIGNGDITTPEQALGRLEAHGCGAVMIGRGAWGNPWLMRRADTLIKTGCAPPEPPPVERIKTALRHTHLIIQDKGPHIGVREMRRHLHMYTKGMRGSSAARVRLNTAETAEAIENILLELLAAQDTF